jgi:hypothetical protein
MRLLLSTTLILRRLEEAGKDGYLASHSTVNSVDAGMISPGFGAKFTQAAEVDFKAPYGKLVGSSEVMDQSEFRE